MEESKKNRCFVTGSPIHLSSCDYRYEVWPKYVHNHSYIEIAIITSGVGIHKINNTSYNVKKGEVYIINTESIHCFYPCDDDNNTQNLSILFIGLYPEYLYDMINEPSLLNDIISMLSLKFYCNSNNEHSFELSPDELEHAKYLFKKMIEELDNQKRDSIDLIKMYLCIMLTEFLRNYSKSVKPVSKTNNYHFSLVKSIINYLSIHYCEKINLTTLSDYHHISPRHLTRIFKEATGFSVFEYLQKIRIEKACLLLKTTDLNVTDIVTLVGFTDYRYFSKKFKNYTGKTPKSYAKRDFI